MRCFVCWFCSFFVCGSVLSWYSIFFLLFSVVARMLFTKDFTIFTLAHDGCSQCEFYFAVFLCDRVEIKASSNTQKSLLYLTRTTMTIIIIITAAWVTILVKKIICLSVLCCAHFTDAYRLTKRTTKHDTHLRSDSKREQHPIKVLTSSLDAADITHTHSHSHIAEMGRVQDGWKISHIAIENNKQAEKKVFALLGESSFLGAKGRAKIDVRFSSFLPFHFENRYTKDISLSPPPPRRATKSSRVWELFSRARPFCAKRDFYLESEISEFLFLAIHFHSPRDDKDDSAAQSVLSCVW